jgi:competence protein ComEC
LGDKFNLDYATIELVRRASLAHTLALSGLHLGFVASLGWILAWLAGKVHAPIYLYLPRPKLAVFLAAPLVLGYMWLGQASFSLLRAGLMFFFWGLLLLFDRRSILLDGLFAALAVIIICSPLSVFDLGLQFSAVAVSGIVLLGPLLYAYYSKWAEDKRWKCWLKVPLIILGISFIANLALLPLLVNSFGRVSPHLYLNLFWLPLLGWLVLPLGLLGLAFLFVPGLGLLGEFLLQGSAGTLELMLAGLGYLDSLGSLNVWVPLRPLWPQAIGYWLLLGLTVLYLYQKKRFSWLLLALGTLLLLAPGVYREVSNLKSKVSLKMLDVGQGQALLIELPRGKRLLIDGGGSWNPDYDLGKYVLAPALTGGKGPMLEQMVLTHADYDHYRGLYYPLRHFAVQEFAFNGQWPPKLEGKKMRRLLEEKDIRTQTWFKGKKIELGRQLFLEVLHPQAGVKYAEENNNSLVFRLVYKHQGLALLPGDIEASALQSLLASGQELRAQVLVLPHHGSRTSFSPEFYQRVQPRLALASAGYLHFFNLPHDQVCEELQRQNVPLYTTAEHGAVTVSWRLNELKPKLGTER